MFYVHKATKEDIPLLESFMSQQKYLAHPAKELQIDNQHLVFYAMEDASLVGYICMVLAQTHDLVRKHVADGGIAVIPEKSSMIVPILLKSVYKMARKLGLMKIHIYEHSKNQHIIDNLKNAGFVQEAEIEKMVYFDGQYSNMLILSKFLG